MPDPIAPALWASNEENFNQWMPAAGGAANDAGFPNAVDPRIVDWFPGATDWFLGTTVAHQYLLVTDDDGEANQLYVDQFDATMSALVARWIIPGWHNATLEGLVSTLSSSNQQVCANRNRVVAIVDLYDYGDDGENIDPATDLPPHYIGVAVFDTAGTLLAQHLVYATTGSGDSYDEGYIASGSGSCTDGVFVYFWRSYLVDPDYGSDYEMAKIRLSDGALTALPINRLAPVNGEVGGVVVVPGGDIITAGYDEFGANQGIVRFGQDGTRRWHAAPDNSDPPDGDVIGWFGGIALSPTATVWAAGPSEDFYGSSRQVEEFHISDGTFVQERSWLEPANHMWLSGVTSSGDDVYVFG